jgi:uncharacterized protein (DUF58 family)
MPTKPRLFHPETQEPLRDPHEYGTGTWAKLRRKFKGPRKLRVTREGKYFIAITFGLGLAAINTGNNLIYLAFGLLISLLALSGVLSEVSLRRLTVVRRLPTRAQVDRAHLVEIEVFNHKGRAPSYAIEVEDLREGQPADKRCFFLKISPKAAQIAAYRRVPAKRGLERHVGMRLATRFPFGLFEKSREVSAPGEIVVYPAVDTIQLGANRGSDDIGDRVALMRGRGDDIVTVRPMREGDDPRDIYWKKSTQPTQRVLRERSTPGRQEIQLRLASIYRGDAPAEDWTADFERRIREVASRSVAHLRRGDAVTITTTGGQRVEGSQESGPDRVLRFLALLEPTKQEPEGRRLSPSRLNARTQERAPTRKGAA